MQRIHCQQLKLHYYSGCKSTGKSNQHYLFRILERKCFLIWTNGRYIDYSQSKYQSVEFAQSTFFGEYVRAEFKITHRCTWLHRKLFLHRRGSRRKVIYRAHKISLETKEEYKQKNGIDSNRIKIASRTPYSINHNLIEKKGTIDSIKVYRRFRSKELNLIFL